MPADVSRGKAQTTSLEFFIVSGVIVLTVVTSYIMYDLASSRTRSAQEKIALELQSVDVIDNLLKTNGAPGNWEGDPSSATSIGLVNSPHKLDNEKVNAFVSMNYNTSKKLLGLDNYDYYFSIVTLNETILKQSGLRPVDPQIIINPTLASVYNNNVVYINLWLWR